jgi:type II secretory pathway pseudopilin PulG
MNIRMSRRRPSDTSAFTLVEAAVAVAVLAGLIAALTLSLTRINHWASSARLHTLALALAQQRVDDVLTARWQVSGARPAVLAAGTVTENNLRLNDDPLNGQTGLSSDFTALDTPVFASRVTTIVDVPPRSVRATVVVTVTYRWRASNIPHVVTLSTLRTTDDI